MRKATLILGLGYLFWGLWTLFSTTRLISLYQEFDANIPPFSYLLPVGILIYGTILLVGYFANIKNTKAYKALFLVGLAFVGFWILYILIAGSVANRQIDAILTETNLSTTNEESIDTGWKTYTTPLSGGNASYPSNWFVLESSDAELLISNIDSVVVYKQRTYTPDIGQVVIHFAFVHSALENYSSGRHLRTSPSNVSVVVWGRYLGKWGSSAIETHYRDGDANIESFENIIKSILDENNIVGDGS